MADKSSIEWTRGDDGTPGSTWNPTRGCDKIAKGCAHCYAETFAERFRGVKGHPYELGFDPRLAPNKLTEPLQWKKPRRIFVDSMSDLFHEAFPFEYIAACFGVMAACQRHTFQVLTKRPERALEFFAWMTSEADKVWSFIVDPRRADHAREVVWAMECLGRETTGLEFQVNVTPVWPLPNVHIGTSAAEQKDVDKNLPVLAQIPAALRFVSIEPLISALTVRGHLMGGDDPGQCLNCGEGHGFARCPNYGGVAKTRPASKCTTFKRKNFAIGWGIVGAESGPGARPCDIEWIASIVTQFSDAGVPLFVKQLGAKPYEDTSGTMEQNFDKFKRWPGESLMLPQRDIGPDKWAPRLKHHKGADMAEWPASLRVRQMPEAAARKL